MHVNQQWHSSCKGTRILANAAGAGAAGLSKRVQHVTMAGSGNWPSRMNTTQPALFVSSHEAQVEHRSFDTKMCGGLPYTWCLIYKSG